MYHDKHSAGFVLHHPPRHAKPSGHSAMMRAACAFLAAACLVLSVTVYPASAATSTRATIMVSFLCFIPLPSLWCRGVFQC